MRIGCVAIISQMDVCSEYLSVCFKQHTVIEISDCQGVPVEIDLSMQFVYGDDCNDVSSVISKCEKMQVNKIKVN